MRSFMLNLRERALPMWRDINDLCQKLQKTPSLNPAFAIFPVFYV